MQFVQFDIESQKPNTSGKKKAIAIASGVLAIAAVTCVALLFVNSGSQATNLDSTNELSFPIWDKHDVAAHILSFQPIFGITQKKMLKVALAVSNNDQKVLQHTAVLFLTYTFDLIDSDGNKSVDQKEWTAIVTSLFPQDVNTYSPLFSEVNGGQPFNFEQYAKFFVSKSQSKDIKKLAPTTPPDVTKLALAKLVLNDNKNYEHTYTLVFAIFDQDDNKVVTKEEAAQTLTALSGNAKEAKKNAEQIFAFAKQNKFSADGKTVKFEDFKTFAVAIQKPLQDQLNGAKNLYRVKELENYMGFLSIHSQTKELYRQAYKHAFTLAGLNAAQQKVVAYLFNTVTTYEFSLYDTDGNNVITSAENRDVINSIFKNEEDRKYYYADFDGINGGKEVTFKQFQQKTLDKMQKGTDATKYKPKENAEAIEKRIGAFILKNDRNYELTYNFVFNLFDVDQSKTVTLKEVSETAAIFTQDKKQLAQIEATLKDVFTKLKGMGVGDGTTIPLAQWVDFAKKIRPALINQLGTVPTLIFFDLY